MFIDGAVTNLVSGVVTGVVTFGVEPTEVEDRVWALGILFLLIFLIIVVVFSSVGCSAFVLFICLFISSSLKEFEIVSSVPSPEPLMIVSSIF